MIPQDLLQPEYLRSVAGLELLARRSANSRLTGFNPSRKTGTGQEFSQYRSYQYGDDPRLLDWKLYARSDRFYIREAELETNLQIRFVLDASASMLHEDNGLNKLDYARYLIATLAWLANNQGDSLSLFGLNDQQIYSFTPKPGRQYFRRFLYELLQIGASGQFPEKGFQQTFSPKTNGPALTIFLTDLYEQKVELTNTIKTLSQTKSEVLLFHLMGHNELELDFGEATAFEDLETGQRVQLDPRQYRKMYKMEMIEYLEEWKKQLLSWQVSYQLIRMKEPIGRVLQSFLQKRKRSLT